MLARCVMIVVFPCVALTACVAMTGCQLERLFPEKVGAGAARLSVRNAVKIISIIDEDTVCGIRSPEVLASYTQVGEVGQIGSVTWTVQGCALDFGDGTSGGTDCNDSETTIRGRIVVDATRTVEGLLTGNPERPVIPQSPDAVTFSAVADVEDYEIRLSDTANGLVVRKGHIEITTAIPLAQSASLAVCAVSTNDVTVPSIKYTDAVFTIDDGERIFDVDVPRIDIEAQIGIYDGRENYLDGTITVWDKDIDLSNDHWLDIAYERDFFRNAFACKDDITDPVSYECLPLTPKLADGVAKLTVNNVGNLVSTLVANDSCGFASADVIAGAQVTGEIGKEGGEVVYRIESPCSIDLPVKTALSRDCTGKTLFGRGAASVTGTMKVRGRRTGDPAQPIIPTSQDPAEIAFNVAFEDWQVSDDQSDKSLQVTGSLTGRLMPRMGIDALTGACSIATPVATFEDLTYQPGATAVLRADGDTFYLAIDGSSLDAQNGNKDGRENILEGSITVDGMDVPIPVAGPPVLDPDYDAANFAAGFSCTPNLVLPTSGDQCNFKQVIGDGAARLIIQTAGTLAGMINGDGSCGFEDLIDVVIQPVQTVGEVGEMGSMTWAVDDCSLGDSNLNVQGEDCLGGATLQQGYADVDAVRTVEGERTEVLWLFGAIEPRDDSSVHIYLTEARLWEFVVYPLAPGESTPIGKLTIHEGTLSALVEPATGARANQTYTFDIPTPVARISNVHLRDARATLESQGKVFEIFIADTQLDAVNGSIDGVTNMLTGSIVVDGDTIDVSGPLNPSFDEATFEDGYLCTENLAGPVR